MTCYSYRADGRTQDRKPITLNGLDPVEALKAILKVDSDAPEVGMALIFKDGPLAGEVRLYDWTGKDGRNLQFDQPDFYYRVTDEFIDGHRVAEYGGDGRYSAQG